MNENKIIKSLNDLPEKYEIISHSNEESKINISKEYINNITVLEIKVNSKDYRYWILVGGIQKDQTRQLMSITNEIKKNISELPENKSKIRTHKSILKKADANLIKTLNLEFEKKKEKEKKSYNTESTDSDSLKKITQLFLDSESLDASDIHIEQRESETIIRFRINGDLEQYDKLSSEEGRQIISTIFNSISEQSSGTNFNPSQPQDALIDDTFNGRRLRFRFASSPAEPDGNDAVLRTLKLPEDDTSFLTMKQLGYNEKSIKLIDESLNEPEGSIIMAGTTGSGKSTTINNLLKKKVYDGEGKIKIITVEDPTEYFIKGATQIAVRRDKDGDAKKSFKASIRAAMRQDPDVILIGEIRDEDTGELFVAAAQTGHQVLTTVHAASAIEIIPRLSSDSIGIKRDVLSSAKFINLLMYQKLIQKLCPDCSIPLEKNSIPPKHTMENIILQNNMANLKDIINAKKKMRKMKKLSLLRALQDDNILSVSKVNKIKKIYEEKNKLVDYDGLYKRITSNIDINKSDIRFKNENGCEKCDYKGIIGRTVIAEVLKPDNEILRLIEQNKDRDIHSYWKKILGGKTVYDDAIDKLKLGIIDPWDFENKLNFIGLKESN